MKLIFRLIFALILTNNVWANNNHVVEAQGHWVGNGGDSMAMAIYFRASELQQKLKSLNPACSSILDLSAEKFENLLKTVKINTSPDPLYLIENGIKVYKEAINYPKKGIIIFNRDVLRTTPSRDYLIIHEFLGLAEIPDLHYKETLLVYESLKNKSCLSEPIGIEPPLAEESNPAPIAESEQISKPEPIPEEPLIDSAEAELAPGEIPFFNLMDKNGVIYFLVAGRTQVYRYSLSKIKYLTPLVTSEEPRTIAISSSSNRVYVAFSERKISYFDLANPNEEHPFVVASLKGFNEVDSRKIELYDRSEISNIFAFKKFLIVISNQVSWLNVPFYGEDRKPIGQMDWVDAMSFATEDPTRKGIYYLSTSSPRDLRFLPGKFNNAHHATLDSPYHGDYRMKGPIVVSPTLIALGSGNIFSNGKMEFVGSIGTEFDMGAWIGSQLYVGKILPQGFNIESYVAPNFLKDYSRTEKQGALIALYTWNKKLVVIWLTPDGEVKIETNSFDK